MKSIIILTTMLAFSVSTAAHANPKLHKAIMIGSAEEAIAMMQAGESVEPQCEMVDVCSPLLAAIESSQPKIIKHLIKHKVNLNTNTALGFSALDMALQRYYAADDEVYRARARKVARRMIKGGADINRFNDFGQNGLNQAAMKGDGEMVTLMLKHGAKIDAVGKGTSNMFGATSLMLAAEKGHKQVVELLLAAGADKAKQDQLNRTAADYARTSGHKNIVALLK